MVAQVLVLHIPLSVNDQLRPHRGFTLCLDRGQGPFSRTQTWVSQRKVPFLDVVGYFLQDILEECFRSLRNTSEWCRTWDCQNLGSCLISPFLVQHVAAASRSKKGAICSQTPHDSGLMRLSHVGTKISGDECVLQG